MRGSAPSEKLSVKSSDCAENSRAKEDPGSCSRRASEDFVSGRVPGRTACDCTQGQRVENQMAEAFETLRLSRPPLGKGALLGCNSHDRYSVGAPGFEQEREWWVLPSNWQGFAQNYTDITHGSQKCWSCSLQKKDLYESMKA